MSSYQVFARKYRPQTFAEVVGQEHVTRTLENAVRGGRIAQAYLFVGPRGTGKTSLARILSKALNCPGGPKVDFDNADDVCQEIAEGRSLDVLEIDGASNNGVEEVRDLREKVRYAPTRGQFKIYYIDEVHMLTTAAFNALLKTLEEPPAHVKFIFATTEAHKLPATILSRCQRFDLRRIPDALIAEHLGKICGWEKIKAEPAALEAIARYAEGGLRDAEVALDQAVSFYGNQVEEVEVLKMFGLAGLEPVARLAGAVVVGDVVEALGLTRELTAAGKDLGRLTQDLLRFFRNVALHQASPEAVSKELTAREFSLVGALAGKISIQGVLDLLSEISDLEGRLRYATAREVIFEVGILQLCHLKEKISIERILQQLSSGGGETESSVILPRSEITGSSSASGTAPAPRSTVASVKAVQNPAVIWGQAVERFAKERPLEAASIRATQFVECKGDSFEVLLPMTLKSKLAYFHGPRNLVILEEVLAQECGRPMRIVFLLDDLAAKPKNDPPFKPQQNVDFTSDPLIKEALEMFQARVVGTGKLENSPNV